MTIQSYEEAILSFGDIISAIIGEYGYEIRVKNKTGKLATYQRLYAENLESEYKLIDEAQEPAYYKAYFIKRNI
tara:strand:+ start:1600 stop:1821 length:222 start_codon:yes stop_codon:yes gene_type:complete